jgi:pimeloyl-ACP methyl ester carboxylesterase
MLDSMPMNQTEPQLRSVQCASVLGLHRICYAQWGDPRADKTILCVHGLTRTGRDFDTLARALAADARVICPDMIGRGRSDRAAQPSLYQIPQYVSDCITLIARLDIEKVRWIGTSMGGLIGMALAGLKGSPIERLVLNDVGPEIDPNGLQRIAQYVGQAPLFDSFEAGVAHSRQLASGFGRLTDEQWRQLHLHYVLQRADGRWGFHYDPAIAVPLRQAIAQPSASDASASVTSLWPVYDAIRAPTLILRGAQSDVLAPAVAKQMCERGPRAKLIEFADVGHAPALMSADQIEAVRQFILSQ